MEIIRGKSRGIGHRVDGKLKEESGSGIEIKTHRNSNEDEEPYVTITDTSTKCDKPNYGC